MKIVFTSGQSGGHFYPIIAVAQQIHAIAEREKFLKPELFYLAPSEYNKDILFENDIAFEYVTGGKMRRYFSIKNVFDIFKSAFGFVQAILVLFRIYPDVVFSKGGGESLPVVVAAKLLGIPVFIHESDTVPGRANKRAGGFATRIGISFAETAEFFPKEKVALVGNPIRREILNLSPEGARAFLELEENLPVILILGGSQGAKLINETIVEIVPELVKNYAVIHQTGATNKEITARMAALLLEGNEYARRYKSFDFLNASALRMAASVSTIVVSRAGGTIFEIANWSVPSILVPISDTNGDHQRKNAYSYARQGATIVVEESNLTPNVLLSEITRLMEDPQERDRMAKAAKAFAKPDAAETVAREILSLALTHEK